MGIQLSHNTIREVTQCQACNARGANTLAVAASANAALVYVQVCFHLLTFSPVCHVHKAERLGDARAGKSLVF